MSQKSIRFIAVYLPNSLNYELSYFESIFRDFDGLVMDTISKRYAVVMPGDFNLHLNEGDRGRIMQDFCANKSMDIANRATRFDDPDTWTFKNSCGHLRRLS